MMTKTGFLLLLFVPSLGVAQLPVIDTRFAIESQLLTQKLDRRMAALEAELSREIAKEAWQRFGFLQWSAVAGDSAAGFVVTLRERSTLDGPEFGLTYGYVRGGASRGLQIGSRRPLYPALQPGKPLTNANNELRDDILERVRGDLDAFRRQLHERFLRDIPLTTIPPEVNAANKMFIIPLKWDDLHAGWSSILRINFSAPRPDTNVLCDGDIAVSDLAPAVDTTDALVRGRFKKFSYPFFDHTLEEGEWHPQIPSILARNRVQKLTVYMLIYDPSDSDDTTGTRVTSHN